MKFEFSAGGIVYKQQANQIQVLLAQHSQHHGWIFPKGHIGDHIKDETKQQTALREVEEETGVKGELQQELPEITYWYNFEGEKRHKTVYYYIMRFIEGDITHHDHEMEAVEWLPIEEVESRLTFPSDKTVWQQAQKILTTVHSSTRTVN